MENVFLPLFLFTVNFRKLQIKQKNIYILIFFLKQIDKWMAILLQQIISVDGWLLITILALRAWTMTELSTYRFPNLLKLINQNPLSGSSLNPRSY